jgi:sugar porter (SP) family MFS transporter
MTKATHSMTRTTLLILMAAALAGLVYGHDVGIIGPALLLVSQEIPMDSWHQGALGGSVFAGGALAILFSGLLADWLGRKRMLVFAALISCIGISIAASAHSFALLTSGRLIQGIGVGIITLVTPLYLSESTPVHVRGRAMGIFQLTLTGSIMLAYAIGRSVSHNNDWRFLFLSALIPALLLLIGTLLLPRSPHWLVMKNKLREAKRVLNQTYCKTDAEHTFGSIVNEQLAPKTTEEKRADRRLRLVPLTLVLLAAILTQLTGINSLLQYAPLILRQAGLTSAEVALTSGTVVIGASFVMTLIALLLIDKFGRRRLLLIGTIGIAIALACCGAVFQLLPTSHLRGLLFLAGFVLFMLSYSVGPGLVIWLIIAELLPDRMRSSGMSLALFTSSITSFALASLYLKISETIGFSGLFWACGLFALSYTWLAWRYIPETQGKFLADINQSFGRHPRISLENVH